MSIPIFQDLVNLVYPRSCPACQALLLEQEKAFCWACIADLETTHFEESPQSNPLFMRFAGKVPLSGAAALFFFDKPGKFKALIEALKYGNQPQVGFHLGRYYANILKESEFREGIEALIPVPLHKSKIRKRGYNQAEAIANGMAEVWEVPVLKKHLIRTKKTKTQTQKSKIERWENVKDGFSVPKPEKSGFLLVDDVITTGATLEACIRTLYAADPEPKLVKVLSLGTTRED